MNQSHSMVPEFILEEREGTQVMGKVLSCLNRDFTALVVDLEELQQQSLKALDLQQNIVSQLQALVLSVQDMQ